MLSWEKNLNALMALMIACILFGALAIQFFLNETPCPLCLLQRLGMLGIASGALMNVKWGPRKRYYGISLFAGFFGGFVALRQIALHVCPGFPTFGHPFWGLSLYVWSFITFVASVLYISLLLMIFDKRLTKHRQWSNGSASELQSERGSVSGLEESIAKGYGRRKRLSLIEVQRAYMDQGRRLVSKREETVSRDLNRLAKLSFVLIFAASFINIFTTFWQCGLSLCVDV